MFYKIGSDYYILVGNKYIQVEFKINGNEINAIPTKKEIEKNSSVKAISQPFDDNFKKQLMSKKEEVAEEGRNKERSRFGR